MKKKLLTLVAFLMCAMMAFAMTACGDSSSGDEEQAASGDVTTLRLALVNTEGTPIYEATKFFADRVDELSEGTLKIDLYPGGSLGDYTATFTNMTEGTLDMCWDSVSSEYDKSLELAGAPYIVSNWAQVKEAYTTDSWLGKYIAERYQKLGVRVLGYTPGGFFVVAGNNVGDVDTLFDLDVKQNATCRIPPMDIYAKLVEALNFNQTTVAYADLYTALQTGVADCWVGGGPSTNYENFRDVIKYCVCYNYANEIYPLSISEQTWEKLTEDQQNILIQAGQEATDNAYKIQSEAEEGYYQKLKDAGIEVITTDEETLAEISQRVRDHAWPALEETCGKEVVQELYDYADELSKIQ